MKRMNCRLLSVLFALALLGLTPSASAAGESEVDAAVSNAASLVVRNIQAHPEKWANRTPDRTMDAGDGLALLWFGLIGVLFLVCWCCRDKMNLSAANRILQTNEMTRPMAQDVLRRLHWLKDRFRPVAEPKQVAAWMRSPLSTLDQINARATEIAGSLGLKDVTFAVCFREMDLDQAVRWDVDERDGCVTIGLSFQLMGHRDAILFALCREAMRTFLGRHAGCGGEAGDEGLVDVACIYFGMGRLVLNGALTYWERTESGAFSRTLRQSAFRFGGLEGSQHALAYDFCARMCGRKLSDEPGELSGMARAIFGRYRRELGKIGPLADLPPLAD